MTVGIVGLGLIGGSMALAYSKCGHRILVYDKDETIVGYAIMSGAASEHMTDDNIGECDLILIAIPPKGAIAWLEANAEKISSSSLVIDCCGTKRDVCSVGFRLAEKYGFTFVGGHPMAGTQYSGFKYAKVGLFRDAPMVIVPPVYDDIKLLSRVKQALAPAEFGSISVTTAEKHDEMIAFTSQLAHVVSNAYVKSPTASMHKGFSAGSYKDLTRVAWLNAPMWTELFMENKDCLIHEVDVIIESLKQYRDAMESNNSEELCRLLEEGKKIKSEIDGK